MHLKDFCQEAGTSDMLEAGANDKASSGRECSSWTQRSPESCRYPGQFSRTGGHRDNNNIPCGYLPKPWFLDFYRIPLTGHRGLEVVAWKNPSSLRPKAA